MIHSDPKAVYFKPRGIPLPELDTIILGRDELEAVRLADLEGKSHGDGATSMGVSRQTFGRIVISARQKIADALVNGKAILVQGNERHQPTNNPGEDER